MALVLERAVASRDGLPLPVVVREQSSHEDIESHLEFSDAWMYVAEDLDGDKIVGFVIGHSPLTPRIATTAEYLALLMTEPNYWGFGIGTALLDRAAEEARAKSKHEVFLWVAATNVRARRLYEHHGYRLAERQRVHERQGLSELYRLGLSEPQ